MAPSAYIAKNPNEPLTMLEKKTNSSRAHAYLPNKYFSDGKTKVKKTFEKKEQRRKQKKEAREENERKRAAVGDNAK